LIELPEGVQVTRWCSLFCRGNEAVGEITIDHKPGYTVQLPICEECLEKAKLKYVLDTQDDGVLE